MPDYDEHEKALRDAAMAKMIWDASEETTAGDLVRVLDAYAAFVRARAVRDAGCFRRWGAGGSPCATRWPKPYGEGPCPSCAAQATLDAMMTGGTEP